MKTKRKVSIGSGILILVIFTAILIFKSCVDVKIAAVAPLEVICSNSGDLNRLKIGFIMVKTEHNTYFNCPEIYFQSGHIATLAVCEGKEIICLGRVDAKVIARELRFKSLIKIFAITGGAVIIGIIILLVSSMKKKND